MDKLGSEAPDPISAARLFRTCSVKPMIAARFLASPFPPTILYEWGLGPTAPAWSRGGAPGLFDFN